MRASLCAVGLIAIAACGDADSGEVAWSIADGGSCPVSSGQGLQIAILPSEGEVDHVQGVRRIESISRSGSTSNVVLRVGEHLESTLSMSSSIALPFSAGQDVWVDMTRWLAFNSEYGGVIRDEPGGRLLLAFLAGWIERIDDSRFNAAGLALRLAGSCPPKREQCWEAVHHEVVYGGSADPLVLLGASQGQLEIDGDLYTVHQGGAFSTTGASGTHVCADALSDQIGFVIAAQQSP